MPKIKPENRGPQDNGAKAGKVGIKAQPLEAGTPTRGASMQGERQNAKGAPAGANQGGAPRGGSRVEPSHQKRAAKQGRAKK